MGPGAAGLLGFGAGLGGGAAGGPHAAVAAAAAAAAAHPLLKPAELHTRDTADLKSGHGSTSAEERLVSFHDYII